MPQVDVIIPAYNAARYLPTALESVVAQTFEDWRILLVDDGSTDDTGEVVAPFIERLGDKLKYIRQANGGVSAARNCAIRHSSAQFLALLDADDLWLPYRLSESLKCFENAPQVGLAYGNIARIDQAGEVIETFKGRQRHGEGRVAPYIFMRKIQLPTSTITFRRACVDAVGGFDESLRVTEDRDLWLRIAFLYEVAACPAVTVHYRTSPGSLTADPDVMLNGQKMFIEKNRTGPGCEGRSRRIALSCIYRERAETLSARGRPLVALLSALRALAYYPVDWTNLRVAASLLLKYSTASRWRKPRAPAVS